MAENLSIDLGKVSIMPKGAYSAETAYERLDAVSANNSCYLSLQDNNLNHALTDKAWWFVLVDGAEAQAQAKEALQQANNAHTMAERAEKNAQSAQTAAEEAKTAAQNATEATQEANEASQAVNEALDLLLNKYGIFIIPTGLTVKPVEKITSINKTAKYIEAQLEPETALPNIIFISDNKSVTVQQDGRLTVVGVGKSTVQVIPTMNTSLAKTLQVEVIEPTLRLVTKTAMRLTGSGALRFN